MGRPPSSCCGEELRREEGAMKKGAWTAEEDEKLVAFIKRNKGHGSWRTLPKLAGLDRCGKSCRLRWTNYLRPNIKRGNFSPDEERIIVQLHAVLGNKWSAIASHLPGRTDNEVKNHWNTHLKKRLTKMGIDPATHLPFNVFTAQRHLHSNPTASMSNADWQKILLQQSLQQVNSTMACHLLQWEIARLEAEARQQIASSHGAYIQNYCTSWLQNLHQNQSDHAHDLNALLEGAANAQLTVHSQSLPNVSSSNQFHVSRNSESKHLGSIPLSLCQGHDDTSPSINSLQNLQCPALSNEESEQLQDDCVLTSASTGGLDSCGSSDSLSSPLLPSHFDVPEDLLNLDLSSDESRNLASIVDPHESSPLTLDDPPAGQQDSYWNRVLYFLDQGTLGSL